MIFNQLAVRPTDDTMQYLSSLMAGSPLDIDIESFEVIVMISEDPIMPDPERVYEAATIHIRPWYDGYLQRSNLLLSLRSPQLQQRCIELNEEGVLRAFFNAYNPYMVVRKDMPALSRHFKTFILQMGNALGSNERVLQFTDEYVRQVDYLAPPNAEYESAMMEERATIHGF